MSLKLLYQYAIIKSDESITKDSYYTNLKLFLKRNTCVIFEVAIRPAILLGIKTNILMYGVFLGIHS